MISNAKLMQAIHVVVDLETLGTRPGSVILQVGANAFCTHEALDSHDNFAITLNKLDSLGFGFTTDKETEKWWSGQSEATRIGVFNGTASVAETLTAFDSYMERLQREAASKGKDLLIWGNSNDFDLGLLRAYYQHFGQEIPWNFRKERDFRTLKELFPATYNEAKRNLVNPSPHDAYCDAKWEAQVLEHILLKEFC